ncbi:MAG: trypsin-like peptidase domain-containing protein [Pseudomonadota bacterium]
MDIFSRRNLLFAAQCAGVGLVAAILLHYFILSSQQSDTRHRDAALADNSPRTEVFSYRDAVARAAPSVVNIFTRVRYRIDDAQQSPLFNELFGDSESGQSRPVENNVGSGVIVSADGYIITNHHVIANAEEIRVILTDGGSFPAVLIGTDTQTDLALLKIRSEQPFPAVPITVESDIRVGDVVLAIGNPFGVGQTVTQGIVSATGRNRLGLNTFEEFIQTDAAINPGNSGGALINPRGELIGINSAIFTNREGAQGISFAIPISLARNVMEQLLAHGEVIRGWLGVQAYDITQEMRERFEFVGPGVLVTGVFYDSPAERAGIQSGDILTHIEGQALHSTQALLNTTKIRPPSTRVKISGLRNGKGYSVMATLAKQPMQVR